MLCIASIVFKSGKWNIIYAQDWEEDVFQSLRSQPFLLRNLQAILHMQLAHANVGP